MTNIEYNIYHIQSVLELIVMELDYAHKINYRLLIIALTKKISLIRKIVVCVKEVTDEIIIVGYKILNKFSKYLETCTPDSMTRKLQEYTYMIGNWLEPLDRAQMLKVTTLDTIDVLHVIQNYETRCFPVHQRLRLTPAWQKMGTSDPTWIFPTRKKYGQFAYCTRINRESLIRHMMLHATVDEFKSYVYDLTVLYYHFGWTSQLEAYENVVRITIETIQLTMVYYDLFPVNVFYTLLCTLIKFCKMFARKSDANSHETIGRILLKALFSLKQLMNNTQYAGFYNSLLWHIDNMFANKSYTDIEHYFQDVKGRIQACFAQVNSISIISFEDCFER